MSKQNDGITKIQIQKTTLTAREGLIRDFLLEMILVSGMPKAKFIAASKYADAVLGIITPEELL